VGNIWCRQCSPNVTRIRNLELLISVRSFTASIWEIPQSRSSLQWSEDVFISILQLSWNLVNYYFKSLTVPEFKLRINSNKGISSVQTLLHTSLHEIKENTKWRHLTPWCRVSQKAGKNCNPRVHQFPLCQMNSVHTLTYYFSKIHFILSSHLVLCLPWCLFPWGSPLNFVCITHVSMHVTWPTHLIHLDLIILTISCEEDKLWSSSLCSFLQSPVNSSLLGSNILLLQILFSNILICIFSLQSDQNSHPYKTTG